MKRFWPITERRRIQEKIHSASMERLVLCQHNASRLARCIRNIKHQNRTLGLAPISSFQYQSFHYLAGDSLHLQTTRTGSFARCSFLFANFIGRSHSFSSLDPIEITALPRNFLSERCCIANRISSTPLYRRGSINALTLPELRSST